VIFAALLVVGLGLLIGLALLPTIIGVSDGTATGIEPGHTYVANPNPTVYVSNPVAYNASSTLNILAAGTPLLDIVHLLGICFIGIIILGTIWVVGKRA
jgi:hypothetical protein